MDHVYRLTDGITSLAALALVLLIGATALLLLPRRRIAQQHFWIVPCVTLSLTEAITDNVPLAPLAEAAMLTFAGTVVAVILARRAQNSLGRATSLPVTILTCLTLILVAPATRWFSLDGTVQIVVDIGAIVAACCWPMVTPRILGCMRTHRERVVLFMLILAFAIATLTPDFDDHELHVGYHLAEMVAQFLGVVIGFMTSAIALRGAIRENEKLAEREHAARIAQEEAAKFLQELIDVAPAAVFVKDLEGRYRLINRLAAAWIGRPEEEILGRSDFELFPESVAAAMRSHDAATIESGCQQNREFSLRVQQDDEERSMVSHNFPLLGASGKLNAVAGLMIDVTQTKLHERELIDARFKAEEASSAKSNFLAHMSHELRTPLNAIIGFSEVIENGLFGPDNFMLYQRYAGDIHHAGVLLLALVDDLLDISRIETGTFEVSPQSVDLAVIADECCRLLRDQAARKNIRLVIDKMRPLPTVTCDKRATLQILVNLVGNAIRHMPSDRAIRIAGGRTENGAPYFVVEDDGPGLPSAVIRALLDPWTHQSAVVTKDGRSGMGLLLSRRLIEVQGGRLFIESSPGKGTRVACQFANSQQNSAVAARAGGA